MDWDKKIIKSILFVLLTVILACNKNQYGIYHAYVGDYVDTFLLNNDSTLGQNIFNQLHLQNNDSSSTFIIQDSLFSNELLTLINNTNEFKTDTLSFNDLYKDTNTLFGDVYDSSSLELDSSLEKNNFVSRDSMILSPEKDKCILSYRETDSTKYKIDTYINSNTSQANYSIDSIKSDTAGTTKIKLDHINKIEINKIDTVILNINSIIVNNIDTSNHSNPNESLKNANPTPRNIALDSDSVNHKDTVYIVENNIQPSVKSKIETTNLSNTVDTNSSEIQEKNNIKDTLIENQNLNDSTLKSIDTTIKTHQQIVSHTSAEQAESIKIVEPINKTTPTDSIVSKIYQKIKHELNGEIDAAITKKLDSLVKEKFQTNNITPKPIYQYTDTIYYYINQIAADISIPKISESNKNCIILLSSYTDAIGNEVYNLLLSKKRAEFIKEKLTQQGYKDTNIFIQYFGEKYATGNHSYDRKLIIKFICLE